MGRTSWGKGDDVRTLWAALAAGAVLLCSGCTAASTETASTATIAASSTSVSASATPEDAAFAAFNATLQALAGGNLPQSADILSALETNAGIAASTLTVTADRTPTGLAVDTVSVGYRYDTATCFIGQFIDKNYVGEIAAPVNGVCLIGVTG